MGLHQRHTHGRVFRGEEAREQLKIRKRDSHGDSIKLHVPEGFQAKQVADDEPQQAASVVYVTLPQTFEGPAMYSTLTGDYDPEATDAPQSTAKSGTPNFYTGDAASSTRATRTGDNENAVATSTVVPQNSYTAAQATTLATIAGGIAIGGTPIQATRAATATAAPANPAEPGMTSGGKAGLAIGIIAAFAVVAVIALLLLNRRKKALKGEALNEKHGSFADVGARRAEANGISGGTLPILTAGAVGTAGAGAAAANQRDSSMTEKAPSSLRSTRTASTAPRLSLRPLTQFLPMLGDNKSNGTVNGGEQRNAAGSRNPANNGSDPFADGAASSNPFDEQRRSKESLNDGMAATGVVAAGAAAAAHANGQRHGPSGSWDGSEAGTPRSAQFGPDGAAGVPPPRQPNNVHRVQLDFKPSMDDELELISGALVRLLHEYDDGWALCITMDRSKQGVAPRTCLSKLPVKPRPQGPPPPQGSQGYRPGPPNDQSRGPPQGSNRPAPNGAPGAMQPRPLTPQSARTPSPPIEQQRPMEQASSSGSTSTSPVGSQVPKRKPVGQAM